MDEQKATKALRRGSAEKKYAMCRVGRGRAIVRARARRGVVHLGNESQWESTAQGCDVGVRCRRGGRVPVTLRVHSVKGEIFSIGIPLLYPLMRDEGKSMKPAKLNTAPLAVSKIVLSADTLALLASFNEEQEE